MISPPHNSSTTKIDIAFLSNQKKLYNNIYFDNSNVKIDINNDTINDIKHYRKRIIDNNKQLLNLFTNKDKDISNNDLSNNGLSNDIYKTINNINNPQIELYKNYIIKLIDYFKFIDNIESEQSEINNYLKDIDYNKCGIDKLYLNKDNSYNITNDIIMLNNINEINNNKISDIRKFIINNNNNIKRKILPRKK
tara:strand:- start:33 stop:614 length:582 start_codon:yes stop_codon:yes gene_type:complete